MLVYVRRSGENADATSVVPVARMPPPHVMMAVDQLNDRYHKKCEEYNTRWSVNSVHGEILSFSTGKRLTWNVSIRFVSESWMFTVHGKCHLSRRLEFL